VYDILSKVTVQEIQANPPTELHSINLIKAVANQDDELQKDNVSE